MSECVRLIPLGGFGEIGKNMLLLECQEQLLLIDAGIAFPDDDTPPGIDLLIPDYSYLRENAERLLAIVLTHGHEDHIGGLPYVLRDVRAPVYGTPLTLGLVRAKLGRHRLDDVDLHSIAAGDRLTIGPFDLEFFRVTHSIPDCLGLGIHTPVGSIVHSGDFKFDHTPIDGRRTDFSTLVRLGDDGVRLLISDSTNIERQGHTPSEMVVGKSFDEIFQRAPGRVLVATFASQIHRIQQVFDVAARHGRRVLVSGRSMERNVSVAAELGYLQIPEGLRLTHGELAELSDAAVVILVTGSQGEPVAGLSRLARGKHPRLRLREDDTVVLSATPIPGNEATVWRLINDLLRWGAQVVDHRAEVVHVSGHASREEIALLFNLIRPEFGVPFHGEYRHMVTYGDLAQAVGLPHHNIFLLQNGDVLRLDRDGARLDGTVAHGVWHVDGGRISELGAADSVLQDRGFLSESGVVAAAVSYDFAAGGALAPPVVKARGVRGVDEALCEQAAAELAARLAELPAPERHDRVEVERAGKRCVRAFFERAVRIYPVLQFLLLDPTAPWPEAAGEAQSEPAG
ncbi:MAG: ribonuclease J [Fimbriimonadaceae bacterium]|nr:ribonuclease J [Fimbriimonadaceae bacterium]